MPGSNIGVLNAGYDSPRREEFYGCSPDTAWASPEQMQPQAIGGGGGDQPPIQPRSLSSWWGGPTSPDKVAGPPELNCGPFPGGLTGGAAPGGRELSGRRQQPTLDRSNTTTWWSSEQGSPTSHSPPGGDSGHTGSADRFCCSDGPADRADNSSPSGAQLRASFQTHYSLTTSFEGGPGSQNVSADPMANSLSTWYGKTEGGLGSNNDGADPLANSLSTWYAKEGGTGSNIDGVDPLGNSVSNWYRKTENRPQALAQEDPLGNSLGTWWADGQRAPDGRTPTTREFLLDTSVRTGLAQPSPPSFAADDAAPSVAELAPARGVPQFGSPEPGAAANAEDPLAASLSHWWATPEKPTPEKAETTPDSWYDGGKPQLAEPVLGVTHEYSIDQSGLDQTMRSLDDTLRGQAAALGLDETIRSPRVDETLRGQAAAIGLDETIHSQDPLVLVCSGGDAAAGPRQIPPLQLGALDAGSRSVGAWPASHEAPMMHCGGS